MSPTITKKSRQGRVLELIKRQALYSQQELMDALQQSGITVTQATLSRDMRELGLVKSPHGYQLDEGGDATTSEEYLRRVLREFLLRLDASGNLLVLKTSPGCAHTVAVAMDRVGWDEILGTVAGDDTILAVVSKGHSTTAAVRRLRQAVGWE